jgi:hypothetical protein
MSGLLERAAYRNRWADAYRDLVTKSPDLGLRFERVRRASAESWDRDERLTDDAIYERVEGLIR